GALAVKKCAEGLQKVAATDHTQELSPGAPIGMAIGAEIPPADPAPRGTIWVRAEVHRGIDVAAAPPRGPEARGGSGGGVGVGVSGVRTGVAGRLGGEARKGFWLTRALGPWGWGLRCRRPHRSGMAGPRPLEHDAQPHKRDQHQLGEKEDYWGAYTRHLEPEV